MGNTLRNKSASVAWKDVCLPKNEGSLDLFDIKARNKCFLAKQLWNIHLKTNYVWIKSVHQYFLRHHSIWNASLQRTSSPLWKSILSIRNQLLEDCGGESEAISMMRSWEICDGPFAANTYEYLRVKGISCVLE